MLSSCTSTTGRISCRGEGGEQLGTPPPFSSAALATFSSIERKRRGGACLNLDGAVHPLLVRKYAHRSRFKTTSIPRPDGPRTQHTIVCACLRPGPGIHLIGLLVVYYRLSLWYLAPNQTSVYSAALRLHNGGGAVRSRARYI